MIGGTDIVIPTGAGDAALDICLRVIRRYWPHAVFEDALAGDRAERYELLPIGRLTEILAYQDNAAAREWDEKGADPSLGNTMIHLLRGQGCVTAVVDDAAKPAMRQLLESMRLGLQLDILNLPADKPGGKAA